MMVSVKHEVAGKNTFDAAYRAIKNSVNREYRIRCVAHIRRNFIVENEMWQSLHDELNEQPGL